MPTYGENIGTILLKNKKLTKEQLDKLQLDALNAKIPLEDVLRASQLLHEQDFLEARAQLDGMIFVDLVGKKIDHEVLEIIPETVAQNYQMVAFEVDKTARTLKVAGLAEQDARAREALRYIGRERNMAIAYYLTSREGFESVMKQFGNMRKEVGEALESAKQRFEQDDESKDEYRQNLQNVQEIIRHAPVAKMISVIMRHAVEGNASDIHIEPLEEQSRVRYRIDGALTTSITLPLYIHDALVARVKVIANLKIDETRVPQDGRIRIHIRDRDVEFRVSTLPLRDHEKVVMRVLDTGGKPPQLMHLGYKGRNLEIFNRNLLKPNGMILVTGPTGSGKSMTIFSALNVVNSEDVNISTLEDPVEYLLQGANQSQVHPQVDFSFANGLRSLLRQDPDIIMVGEIRDFETAELAIHAAMTGHLLFSTLHTNSAIDSIARLLDMHIEPYLLSTTINVLLAQRLVRIICKDCKEEVEIDEGIKIEVLKALEGVPQSILDGYGGGASLKNPTFYHGAGCARCGHSGFQGRTAITEAVENSRSLKKALIQGINVDEVEKVLKEQDFLSMKQDGLIKVLMGVTTPEQVFSVTKEDAF